MEGGSEGVSKARNQGNGLPLHTLPLSSSFHSIQPQDYYFTTVYCKQLFHISGTCQKKLATMSNFISYTILNQSRY